MKEKLIMNYHVVLTYLLYLIYAHVYMYIYIYFILFFICSRCDVLPDFITLINVDVDVDVEQKTCLSLLSMIHVVRLLASCLP